MFVVKIRGAKAMCTGFVKKGKDLIAGYNLDLAVGAWDYKVYAKRDMFYVGIKVGSTIYKTHGVNSRGAFGNLPYMNGKIETSRHSGKKYKRIDLVINDYISGKYLYSDVLELAATKELVNVPSTSMHSLLCDSSGNILLLEPGHKCMEIHSPFAVISNFPLLEEVEDFSPVWYGKDRYDKCVKVLQESGENFSVADGLDLLNSVKQTGEWATRLSFIYSRNENTVYYVLDNDFSNVIVHPFSCRISNIGS